MKLRGSLYVGAVVATMGVPLAALAQLPMGHVTTSPVGPAAPALGVPMLVLLALALSVGAVYLLRRKAASTTARLAVVAAVTILAGISYATMPMPGSVVVSGDQCTMRTTQTWNYAEPFTLDNQCSHPLLIEAIDIPCGAGTVNAPACVAGKTLAAGATCNLPFCV